MGHSIYIHDDGDVTCAAGGGGGEDQRVRTDDVSLTHAVAEDNSCRSQPEKPPDATSPLPTERPRQRGRRRRIFLLLTLAIAAAPLAEAALPGAAEPLPASKSWETHVDGVAHRVRDGLPVDLGGETAPGWFPPPGALGHRRDRRVGADSGRSTGQPLCSLDIDLTVSPPALSVRTSLAGVPLPEVHVTPGSLARAVLGCPSQ